MNLRQHPMPRLRWMRGAAPHLRRRAAAGFKWSSAAVAMAVVLWWGAVLSGDFELELLDRGEATSLTVRDWRGGLLRQEATQAGLRESWTNLDAISPHLIHATLASEDNDFYAHSGIDWTAIGRAAWLNLSQGSVSYGGSTVTMQLVHLTAGTSRTLTGKVHQTILARRLERQLGKHDILEHYLNRVYYGNSAWGIGQAALFYFGKSAAELSVGEAAMLAVFPRGPSRYNPFKHWGRTLRRRDHIIGLMHKHGYVTAEQASLARRTALVFAKERPSFRAPHFVEFVKQRLPHKFRHGAEVETTLDLDLQRRIEVAVAKHLSRLAGRHVTQSAVVVLRNFDGAILSMVGSRDYTDRSHNGAFNGVTARLRPGSTLKPFVYATAIENGDTPATIAWDVVLPEDVGEFYSKNVKSHGFARYRESLAGSYNLSAVHTLQRVGVKAALAKLRGAGLGTLDRPDNTYDWGLAIGHAEVRLLDLTAAFSLFGRGGRPIVPRAIESATTPDGAQFSEAAQVRDPVFSKEVAYLLFDILSDPNARKPMFGDRVPMNLPFKVALKTGTTKAYTDNWAVGVTREYTVGVWAGNFDGSPTHQVMSVHGATPLMRAVYTAIASRYGEPTAPERPAAVVTATVCPLSGKRPGPYCQHRKSELFIAGHLPEETCDWHQQVCGQPMVVFPKQVESWARYYGRIQEPTCEVAGNTNVPIRIVRPLSGSKFVLEPHRPPQNQRPPLIALPRGSDVKWTIDGQPAGDWIPTPGQHTIVATRGDHRDEITVVYE